MFLFRYEVLSFTAFAVYQSESTAFVSSGGTFPADTFLTELNPNFDTSTHKFTAPVAGYYEFTFTMGGVNSQQAAEIHAGTSTYFLQPRATTEKTQTKMVSCIVSMSPSDEAYVEIRSSSYYRGLSSIFTGKLLYPPSSREKTPYILSIAQYHSLFVIKIRLYISMNIF